MASSISQDENPRILKEHKDPRKKKHKKRDLLHNFSIEATTHGRKKCKEPFVNRKNLSDGCLEFALLTSK